MFLTGSTATTLQQSGEPWRSDGTPDGTFQLRNIFPGAAGSRVGVFTDVNGVVFFVAESGSGSELWKTDGTAAGTVMVKDILAGSGSSSPNALTALNGKLYFSADDGVNGRELWTSDGTLDGTVMVKDIVVGAAGSNAGVFGDMVNLNGTLYFAATTAANGTELWKSNGTAAGTVLAVDIVAGAASSSPKRIITHNNELYFYANGGIYRSNGTAAGTTFLKSVPGDSTDPLAPPYFRNIVSVGNTVFFSGGTAPDAFALWKTDGTVNGTIALGVGRPENLTNVNGTLFFTSGTQLWKSNGTLAGTVSIKTVNPIGGFTTQIIAVVGSTVYFSGSDTDHGRELWKSDGTAAGTQMVVDLVPGTAGSDPIELMVFNNVMHFVASDTTAGVKLYRTDGTPAGTIPIKPVFTASSGSNPGPLVPLGNGGVFTVSTDIWSTDGTPAGTQPMGLSLANAPADLTLVGNTVYFSSYQQLWKTNGTPGGTALVKDFSHPAPNSKLSSFANLNGTLFFVSELQLWKSDRTLGGTTLVKDLAPLASGASPADLVAVGSRIFFTFTTPAEGKELWQTDGTSAGTTLVRDIYPGASGSSPSSLIDAGGRVMFVADDGVHGTELWASDGTFDGTVLIKDFTPGAASPTAPRNLTFINGAVYLAAYSTAGDSAWRINGTTATFLWGPAGGAGNPNSFTALNGMVLFAGAGVNGMELWAIDPNGSKRLVKDIDFSGTSNPAYLAAVGDWLFFSRGDSTFGAELWATDGTTANTRLVKDINPGIGSSSPINLSSSNGTLYFRADDGTTGAELWKVGLPSIALPSTLTVGQGSSIAIDASQSADPDPAETLTFAWDLDNDGVFGETGPAAARGNETGPSPTFSAANLSPGAYSVRLRLSNASQLSSTQTISIMVRGSNFIGTAGDDAFRVSLSGSAADFYENAPSGAPPTFSIPLANLSPITISAASGDDSLTITSGSFSLASSTNLEHLTLAGNASLRLQTSTILSTVTLLDTSTLDISDFLLTLTSSDLATISPLIQSGKILTSFIHPASRIAAILNNSGELQVLYTLIGDLNFDKTVSIADFITLAASFNKTSATWADGDVNGDGAVTIGDFIDLASNFNKSFAGETTPASTPQAALSTSEPIVINSKKRAHHKQRRHRHHPHPHQRFMLPARY